MTTFNRSGGGISKKELTVEIIERSGTWSVPSGVNRLYLWMCGGGCQGSFFDRSGESSINVIGGISAMPREYVLDVNPGTSYTVAIGAGGTAQGGTTYFGSCTAGGAHVFEGYGNNYFKYGNASGGYGEIGRRLALTTGEDGDAGTLDAYGASANRGYCWLTDEIYCGGGCYWVFRDSKGTHNSYTWSSNATTAPAGGGPALPAVTVHESDSGCTMSVSGSITPASKYGAGGIFIHSYWITFEGEFADPTKLAAYQGVVIVGY